MHNNKFNNDSEEIKQHFAIVKNKTILCSYERELVHKDYEETEDIAFLPSYTEIGFGNVDSSNPEGNHLAQKFINNKSRIKQQQYDDSFNYYWMITTTLHYSVISYIDNYHVGFIGILEDNNYRNLSAANSGNTIFFRNGIALLIVIKD